MTPQGLERLKADEGLRLKAYPDPKSGGAPYTIGYGCTGDGIGRTTTWTQAKAQSELLARVSSFEALLAKNLPWFDALPAVRKDVLVNIAYNVGLKALLSWKVTLGHVRDGLYQSAAHDLRTEGQWNKDVGDRAERLAKAMETGVWP